MMAARDQTEAAKELFRAVDAQLSDTPAALALHWVDRLGQDLRAELLQARRIVRTAGALVVFWCDLTGSDDVYLYLAEPGGGRLLVRRVPQGAPSARAESVAIIVGASVRAHLDGGWRAQKEPFRKGGGGPAQRPGDLGHTKGDGQPSGAGAPGVLPLEGPPDRAITGVPGPRRPPRLSLELGYAVDTYNQDNAPIHGVRLALTLRLVRLFSVFVSFRVLQSVNGRDSAAEVGLQRNPIAMGGILHWRLGSFLVGGSAALVADYVATEARASWLLGGTLDRSDGRGDWHLLGAAALLGGYQVVERLWIELSLGTEFIILSNEYWVSVPEVGGVREVRILRPWKVQPFAVLGIRLEIL